MEFTEFLNNIGYSNSTEVSKKTFEFNHNMAKVFIKFPILQKLEKEKVGNIFIKAYKKDPITNEKFKSLDLCSEAYGDGMEDCDDGFGYGMLGVIAGSSLGGFVGIAGGIAIGGAILYHQYTACREKVVKRWARCRAQNPVQTTIN